MIVTTILLSEFVICHNFFKFILEENIIFMQLLTPKKMIPKDDNSDTINP